MGATRRTPSTGAGQSVLAEDFVVELEDAEAEEDEADEEDEEGESAFGFEAFDPELDSALRLSVR
jgi:hypothetical protein